MTITATNGGGTSNCSDPMDGRSSEAGDYDTYWEWNLICLISLLAPGIVVVDNTDGAVVTWNIPVQTNGIIINYQVIYYIYQNDTAEQSDLLDPNALSYTIPGTGKQQCVVTTNKSCVVALLYGINF